MIGRVRLGAREWCCSDKCSCLSLAAFMMTAQFDKCRVLNFSGQGHRCIREQLMSEDVSGKDK